MTQMSVSHAFRTFLASLDDSDMRDMLNLLGSSNIVDMLDIPALTISMWGEDVITDYVRIADKAGELYMWVHTNPKPEIGLYGSNPDKAAIALAKAAIHAAWPELDETDVSGVFADFTINQESVRESAERYLIWYKRN